MPLSRRIAASAALLSIAHSTAPALAEDRRDPADRVEDSASVEPDAIDPGPLATAAAVVPGVLVSGVGHFVAGDHATAHRLLVIKAIGLGAMGVGGGAIAATGAARRGIGVPVALVMSGAGLFILSWLADIYGAAGGGRTGGRPRVDLPRLELAVAWAHVRDPQFSYDHFTAVEADLGLAAFRIRPSAWTAVGADNQRLRAEVAWRVRGPGASHPSGDGSYLEVGGAALYHRYGDDDFSAAGGELFAGGRYDLTRIGASLAGSYVDVRLGVAGERMSYSIDGAGADFNDMLLGGFAFGTYLGSAGEAEIYYDHRRDGYAGGLSPWDKNGSGFVGSLGVRGFVHVTDRIAIEGGYTLGAAHVARVGMRVSLGGPQ